MGYLLLLVIEVRGRIHGGQSDDGRAVLLFGDYKGSLKTPGFAGQSSARRLIAQDSQLREQQAQGKRSDWQSHRDCGDRRWRVVETAEALFQVDDYEQFVHVQTDPVRVLATTFPYDADDEGQLSLRGAATEVSHRLREEIQERLAKAGVEVIEARISHLAYAPEIANAMLRRQQATAIIAARQKIVEGAVGMVEMALELLSAKQVAADEERKASMVSNLLVVLCSDHDAPVVNTACCINKQAGSSWRSAKLFWCARPHAARSPAALG